MLSVISRLEGVYKINLNNYCQVDYWWVTANHTQLLSLTINLCLTYPTQGFNILFTDTLLETFY